MAFVEPPAKAVAAFGMEPEAESEPLLLLRLPDNIEVGRTACPDADADSLLPDNVQVFNHGNSPKKSNGSNQRIGRRLDWSARFVEEHQVDGLTYEAADYFELTVGFHTLTWDRLGAGLTDRKKAGGCLQPTEPEPWHAGC